MNILLWILQIVLALHTLMGAIWKFTNTEQAVSSLNSIPHGMWLAMSVIEILCAVGLVLPGMAKFKPYAFLVPLSALVILAEMLLFCGVHLSSGETNNSPVIYWFVVGAVCAFIAFGRKKLKPLV